MKINSVMSSITQQKSNTNKSTNSKSYTSMVSTDTFVSVSKNNTKKNPSFNGLWKVIVNANKYKLGESDHKFFKLLQITMDGHDHMLIEALKYRLLSGTEKQKQEIIKLRDSLNDNKNMRARMIFKDAIEYIDDLNDKTPGSQDKNFDFFMYQAREHACRIPLLSSLENGTLTSSQEHKDAIIELIKQTPYVSERSLKELNDAVNLIDKNIKNS